MEESYTLQLSKMLSGAELYNHLMEDCYLPDNWVLPPFIEITNTDGLGEGDEKTREPRVLFAPKAKFKWRQFSFIHPNNYQKVCECVGSSDYNTAFLKLSKAKKIFSYTIPQKYKTSIENSGNNIEHWNTLQNDLLLCSDEYEYILILDISNCYHTMYTHSIEWAFRSVRNKSFGEKLDKAIRRGMDNRTHGIPVGSGLSHYISEIVLLYIDRLIEKNKVVKNFIGGRFRDNYYLLCRNRQDAEVLLKEIVMILRKNNLDFNSDKTKVLTKNDYFDTFWRIDFNTILSKLNIDDKNETTLILPIRKIEAFIGLSLRLSQQHNNDKAIIERLLGVLEKIEPENDAYPKYFTFVQRIYQVRTQTLPQVLGILSLLGSKNEWCKKRLREFLISRLVLGYKARDNFEMMWVIYFLSINNIEKTDEITKYLKKIEKLDDSFLNLICVFYEKSLLGTLSGHGDLFSDLWQTESNTSNLSARFGTLVRIDDILEKFKVKFTTFFGGGGVY